MPHAPERITHPTKAQIREALADGRKFVRRPVRASAGPGKRVSKAKPVLPRPAHLNLGADGPLVPFGPHTGWSAAEVMAGNGTWGFWVLSQRRICERHPDFARQLRSFLVDWIEAVDQVERECAELARQALTLA